MPQYRRRNTSTSNGRPGRDDIEIDYAHNARKVRKSIDVGEQRVSIRAQIDRLGRDQVRKIAAKAGRKPPSNRTLQRWAQQERIPHADLAALVRRADEVARAGGVTAAAQRWGRSPDTIRAWLRNPRREMKVDARARVVETDRADRWTAAGIPHDGKGNITKGAYIFMKGVAHISGRTPSVTRSYDYRRTRVVQNYQLDQARTQEVYELCDRGEHQAAIEIIEQWLGSDYFAAELEGWSDSHGWKWEKITKLELSFDDRGAFNIIDEDDLEDP